LNKRGTTFSLPITNPIQMPPSQARELKGRQSKDKSAEHSRGASGDAASAVILGGGGK